MRKDFISEMKCLRCGKKSNFKSLTNNNENTQFYYHCCKCGKHSSHIITKTVQIENVLSSTL